MIHEVIESPALGWNELPHEAGSYAWWDGHQFTTIAFRADDHWEYVTDPSASDAPLRRRNTLAWIGLWVGIFDVVTLFLAFWLSPVAVTCGIVALKSPASRSERRAAIAAIVLGCVAVIPLVVFLVLFGMSSQTPTG